MEKIYHKTMRIMYHSDKSYENFPNLDNSLSLHQRHLRILVIKIFKSGVCLNAMPSLCGRILV